MLIETLVADTTATDQSYEKFKPLISFMNLKALTDSVKASPLPPPYEPNCSRLQILD